MTWHTSAPNGRKAMGKSWNWGGGPGVGYYGRRRWPRQKPSATTVSPQATAPQGQGTHAWECGRCGTKVRKAELGHCPGCFCQKDKAAVVPPPTQPTTAIQWGPKAPNPPTKTVKVGQHKATDDELSMSLRLARYTESGAPQPSEQGSGAPADDSDVAGFVQSILADPRCKHLSAEIVAKIQASAPPATHAPASPSVPVVLEDVQAFARQATHLEKQWGAKEAMIKGRIEATTQQISELHKKLGALKQTLVEEGDAHKAAVDELKKASARAFTSIDEVAKAKENVLSQVSAITIPAPVLATEKHLVEDLAFQSMIKSLTLPSDQLASIASTTIDLANRAVHANVDHLAATFADVQAQLGEWLIAKGE